ncbi:hypothetical protein ONZ45_g18897 [Pleurotus djamor]|nr:hypothetical protein ONZ45_g18897 [Pleurotus djamor]
MELHYPLIPLPQLDAAARADNRNYMQLEMAIVHNVLLRTLSTVWNYAPLVSPKDQISFARYCLIMVEGIDTHHHNEETIIFPFLATKLSMEDNVEQHKTFQDGMHEFKKYFEGVVARTVKYDGEKAKSLLTAFADPLVQHLRDEIPTLAPEELHKFEKAEFDGMMRALENHLKAQGGLFTVFPLAMCNHDSKEIPNWPPLPAPLRWFIRNIAVWRHASYWKFGSFDKAGRPRVYTPA